MIPDVPEQPWKDNPSVSLWSLRLQSGTRKSEGLSDWTASNGTFLEYTELRPVCPRRGPHDLYVPRLHSPALSLLSCCYETHQPKPRLPQFITGRTKAKQLDKAGQTNPNQLPLNTHITPPRPLTDIQMDNSRLLFSLFFFFIMPWDIWGQIT